MSHPPDVVAVSSFTNFSWRHHLPLFLILCLAFLLRTWWITHQCPIIENEGGEYAAIAEHLIDGKGYVGQGVTGKPQLIFPPAYPVSITLLNPFTHNTETAGRLVSFLMGLWLIVSLYQLGTYAFGRKVGLIAALVAALHPLLIRSSVQAQSETMYFALLLAAVYQGLLAIESQMVTKFILTGGLFGLAYLTRQEAMLQVALFCLFAGCLGLIQRRLRATLLRTVATVTVFLLVASPYVFFLYKSTGQIRLEMKSNVNWVTGKMILAGISEENASEGVNDNMQEIGIGLGQINKFITVDGAKRDGVVTYLVAAAKRQSPNIYNTLFKSNVFGGSLFWCLAFFGLFRRAWDRTRAIRECYLILIMAGSCLALLSLQFFQTRYVFVLLPFLLLWAAEGIDEWTTWVVATQNALSSSLLGARALRLAVGGVLIAGVCAFAFLSSWTYDDMGGTRESAVNAKKAGLWLRDQQPREKIVMDAGTAIPYYAHAECMYLPYSTSVTAIRYFQTRKFDYIILRGTFLQKRPYMQDWLEHGIPSPSAVLLYDVGNTIADKVQVYKWTNSPLGTAKATVTFLTDGH
jgi:4-amino-4-deoxy-L-arabinose transferase-like glycosyltransferase